MRINIDVDIVSIIFFDYDSHYAGVLNIKERCIGRTAFQYMKIAIINTEHTTDTKIAFVEMRI